MEFHEWAIGEDTILMGMGMNILDPPPIWVWRSRQSKRSAPPIAVPRAAERLVSFRMGPEGNQPISGARSGGILRHSWPYLYWVLAEYQHACTIYKLGGFCIEIETGRCPDP